MPMKNNFLNLTSGVPSCQGYEPICNIKTIASDIVNGTLYLLLKRTIFDNGYRFGLVICCNIPKDAGAIPVNISVGIGPNATSYPLITTDGNKVLAYQLKSRCRIPVTVSTSQGAFLVNPRYLCHTSNILPTTSSTTPSSTSETT